LQFRVAMASATLRGVHVAVVGEDTDTLKFIDESLRYHGALLTTHKSLRTVCRLMRVLLVNVLVVDLGEGVDAGLALIRDVRALAPEDGGRVPIVVLYAGPAHAERRVVAEDIDSLVRKPVQASELARIIASVFAASPDPVRDEG